MRRFYLQRNTDVSGVSGLGKVAEGCQFDTGWCALVWLTGKAAMSYYPDIETLVTIHGHQGATQVKWVDVESYNVTNQDQPHHDEPKLEPENLLQALFDDIITRINTPQTKHAARELFSSIWRTPK